MLHLHVIIKKLYVYITYIYWNVRSGDVFSSRSSDENSVCPSVKRVDCDKTKEKCVQIFIPYEWSFSLVLWQEEWLMGWHFYLKFWFNRPPLERNCKFWTDNQKSPMHFPMSLRWSYGACKSPKGGSKMQNGCFPLKSHFAWRKSATRFFPVKTVGDKVERHSLA